MPAASTNPRPRPLNFEDLKARFPEGREITIDNPRAAGPVKAKVVGVRYGGVAGSKGHSIFIDTEEARGEGLKPIKRSCRPAHCTPV